MKKEISLSKKQKKALFSQIGELVRKKRKDAGFSQEALGAHTDIHRTYIGIIERGEVNVTIEMLATIANFLDCEISDFIPKLASIKK